MLKNKLKLYLETSEKPDNILENINNLFNYLVSFKNNLL